MRFISLIIGVIFLLSGLSKIIDSDGFIGTLFQYGFGMFSYIAPLVSPVEVVLGMCLILNYHVRRVSFIVFVLTFIFTIAFLYAHFVRGLEDCGCFGDWLQLSPTVAVLKNVLIMSGALFLLFTHQPISKIGAWKVALVSIFAAFSFAISGYTVDKSLSAALSTNTLEGKKLSETSLKVINRSVQSDQFALFVYSPSCPHCWNTTENIKSLKASGKYDDVFGVVAASRKSSLANYENKMKPNFETLILKDEDIDNTLGMRVPKLLIVKNGVVTGLFQGDEIPCPQLIEK